MPQENDDVADEKTPDLTPEELDTVVGGAQKGVVEFQELDERALGARKVMQSKEQGHKVKGT